MANLLLLLPVLINLTLAAVCDIGLWWILELLKQLFEADVTDEGKSQFQLRIRRNFPSVTTFDFVIFHR